MSNEQENYLFLNYCNDDLEYAKNILAEIKKNKSKTIIIGAAFRYAIIAYAKPFKKTKGKIKKNHILPASYIPEKYLALHKKIMDARDQIHAHSDITIKNAELIILNKNFGVGITENNNSDFELFQHIDDILFLIKGIRNNIYADFQKIHERLK